MLIFSMTGLRSETLPPTGPSLQRPLRPLVRKRKCSTLDDVIARVVRTVGLLRRRRRKFRRRRRSLSSRQRRNEIQVGFSTAV